MRSTATWNCIWNHAPLAWKLHCHTRWNLGCSPYKSKCTDSCVCRAGTEALYSYFLDEVGCIYICERGTSEWVVKYLLHVKIVCSADKNCTSMLRILSQNHFVKMRRCRMPGKFSSPYIRVCIFCVFQNHCSSDTCAWTGSRVRKYQQTERIYCWNWHKLRWMLATSLCVCDPLIGNSIKQEFYSERVLPSCGGGAMEVCEPKVPSSGLFSVTFVFFFRGFFLPEDDI